MKVHVVGTGCTWFSRNNTSFILDDKMIFDMPEGSYKDIVKQIDIMTVQSVYITHLHSDHFNDLHILVTRFMREKEIHFPEDKLKVYGPKGTFEHLLAFNKLIFGGSDECDPELLKLKVSFVEVGDGQVFQDGEYRVTVHQMDHGAVYSQGYSFEDKNGKVYAFSGDTTYCEALKNMVAKANYAFVDMAIMEGKTTHLNTKDFMFLKNLYKECKMFPVHTSDKTQKFAEKNGLNALQDGQTLNLD